ncbi:helix-turn-helix transcriptional regulator [Acinetobacter puyangensis]|uniref:helix-turn-helix transcriptional regulator n=1 Tax=Acinetobacter puyangensis TaxID=1096779 RepID=UPI003A4DCD99
MSSMSRFIDAHKQVVSQVGDLYIETNSTLPNYYYNLFNPLEGHGYSELYDFGRACLGRGQYQLKHPKQMTANTPVYCFGLTVFLSGTHHLKNHQTNRTYILQSPCIILRKGYLGVQTIYLPAYKQMSLITIDFDENFFDNIQHTPEYNDLVRFFLDIDATGIKTFEIPSQHIIHQAQHLLKLPQIKTKIDLLHLEGAALELLSMLLQLTKKCKASQFTAIEQAISILENQFEQKITIPQLSKQVGLNECDLKKAFKQHTGMTIGQFLLEKRMKQALILLKEGQASAKVAYALGYNNPQYFKRVFLKYFGYEP